MEARAGDSARPLSLVRLSILASPVRSGVKAGRPPVTRRKAMAQYLLSVHSVEGATREPMTDEEMQHSWRDVIALEKEM